MTEAKKAMNRYKSGLSLKRSKNRIAKDKIIKKDLNENQSQSSFLNSTAEETK